MATHIKPEENARHDIPQAGPPASNLGFMSASPSDESDSEKQKLEQHAAPPPPNGGVMAWLQVAGAFFLFFNSW